MSARSSVAPESPISRDAGIQPAGFGSGCQLPEPKIAHWSALGFVAIEEDIGRRLDASQIHVHPEVGDVQRPVAVPCGIPVQHRGYPIVVPKHVSRPVVHVDEDGRRFGYRVPQFLHRPVYFRRQRVTRHLLRPVPPQEVQAEVVAVEDVLAISCPDADVVNADQNPGQSLSPRRRVPGTRNLPTFDEGRHNTGHAEHTPGFVQKQRFGSRDAVLASDPKSVVVCRGSGGIGVVGQELHDQAQATPGGCSALEDSRVVRKAAKDGLHSRQFVTRGHRFDDGVAPFDRKVVRGHYVAASRDLRPLVLNP